MPDFDDLVSTLRELRDVIDVHAPLFTRRSTGLEVTQAVQYHRSAEHLTDSDDRAPDNAATLVAYKTAVVRAYVRPGFGTDVDEPMTGRLRVERRRGVVGPWEDVTTLAPWLSATVTPVDDTYAAERGSIWQSLNFRIPAAQFAGHMRLTLELDTGETRTTTVSAYLVQTLRVRVIPIHYQGPSTANPTPTAPATPLDLPAPTLADAQTTAALALRMMPVQQTGSFAIAGSMNWFSALDDARVKAGGCSNNWNSLLAWLRLMRDNDGNRADVVYYGLLPAGTPLNVPGCGVDGIGSAAVGNQTTFVHEIGHGYGFDHTPSGNVGTPDPYYPVYEPYFSASVGEYGVDIQSGQVYSPATSTDYMSYGPARWMSLYQHGRLIYHDRLAPTSIKEKSPFDDVPVELDPRVPWWPDPPWGPDLVDTYALQPLISIRGVVDDAGAVRVDSVARITASPVLHGPTTPWTAQLVGRSGEVVARAALSRVETHGGGCCGCEDHGTGRDPDRLPLEFQALVPDVEPGIALRIADGRGEDVWQRRAPEDPVRFVVVDARIDPERGLLRWAWEVAAAVRPDVWAQYSADGGETWRGLAVGLRDNGAEVGTDGLPAGPVLVRLVAHDGFGSAVSDPMEVKMPERPPHPAILFPADGETLPAGTEIEVLGSAVDQAGNPLEDDRLEWTLDGSGVGHGRTATIVAETGEHELTLAARGRLDAAVTVRFVARELVR